MKLFLEIDINILFQGMDGKLIPSNNNFLIIILALNKNLLFGQILTIQQNPSLP